nr:MAG TPA: hypothetical protein [Caudoviricetes sp.]
MTEFHIRNKVTDEEEFRKQLKLLKALYRGKLKMSIFECPSEGKVVQRWFFEAIGSLWVVADDYDELKELGL